MSIPAPIVRIKPVLLAIWLAMAASALSSCQPSETEKAPRLNVVLISIDTLRADHMGIHGYERDTTPKIDAFFAEGAVFDRAYATTSYTPPSVASYLTGLLPQRHGLRRFTEHIDPDLTSLPKILAEAGYQTAGVVSNAVLSAEFSGLDAHFQEYNDYVTEKERFRDFYERTAGPTTDATLTWFHAQRDPEKPFFLWVHYIDPHGPYDPQKPKTREFSHDEPVTIDPDRVPEYQRYPGLTDGLEYVDLYDEEIAYTDAEVGRLIDGLLEDITLDNTLFVFTADHGETLMDHELWFRHDYHVYEELVRVPFLIRGPGFDARRVEEKVSNMDLVPTVLDVLDLPVPSGLDAMSLANSIPENRDIFVESNLLSVVWRGVISGDTKWVFVRQTVPNGREGMYRFDLANDPAEQRPEPWMNKPLSDAARTLLALYRADPIDYDHPDRFARGGSLREAKPPPEEIARQEEQLRAMGYLE